MTIQISESVLATVVFLAKDIDGGTEFYLAKKKQSVHKDNGQTLKHKIIWNGYGGKMEKSDNSLRACAIRELFTESSVLGKEEDLLEVARVKFFWPGNKSQVCDMDVTFYLLKKFEGTPVETYEMGSPQIFNVDNFPHENMLPADKMIIPIIMSGKILTGRISFLNGDDGKMIIDAPEFIISG